MNSIVEYDAIVVGAGFSGLYSLYCLRNLGLSVKLIERGEDVGGAWYFNRYPGLRCNVESVEYSFSFSEELQQEWKWTEKYASQPEMLRYMQHVAERFNLRKDIEFSTCVTEVHYDQSTKKWFISTDKGEHYRAQYCVMATGSLSIARVPDYKGLDSFKGKWYHTANWPMEGVDFSGKRVAVIGTGSSGIQCIPIIAKQADHLFVFQRSAVYTIPARNTPLSDEDLEKVKKNYPAIRSASRISPTGVSAIAPTHSALEVPEAERLACWEACWEKGGQGILASYTDVVTRKPANDLVTGFLHGKIREIVKDPKTAGALCATYPVGAKRICVDTNYYDTYNQSNVTLVDLHDVAIDSITEKGIKVGDKEYELDAIVFATGFAAVTGAVEKIDIKGENGTTLQEKWQAEGPRAYLGLMASGFPNLFLINGPGSPSVLSNMVISIEQHVEFISDIINHARKNNHSVVDVQAKEYWAELVDKIAQRSLFMYVDSWYFYKIPSTGVRKFLVYLGGVGGYRKKCEEVRAQGYPGFIFA